ncbi:type I restriction enzyme, S subunit [Sinomicrobium oceani]|uniref:Type I restriction enzyme, S subunit n=1 Tax=Sinomicrobium oceani TaxID=1150368 RepID=A0A1K1RWR8_9FLAO|nr:restriction endonuclease subunit S [Sinomicrobium oceani]SFW76513.1 type I restriction enzyme, S subunit [Sinomicrobium oceani]
MIIEDIKEGYKKTKLGWIPEDWECVTIGDYYEFKNGLNKGSEYFGHGTSIINYKDVYSLNHIYRKKIHGLVDVNESERKRYSTKKADLFFTRTSETVDEIGLASVLLDDIPNGVFSGFVLRARPLNEDIFPSFAGFCFRSEIVRKEIIKKSTYTTRALTNGSYLSEVYFALPPINEQKAIANCLSTWDKAIEKQEALLKAKQQVKQGLMQQLLSGKKRLPGFTEEWKKVVAGKIFKSISIKNKPNHELLSVTQDRGVIPRDMLDGRVTMPSGNLNTFKLVKKGNFVISLRSFQGGLEYSNYDGLVSPAYTVLEEISNINRDFYKYYFKSYEFIERLSTAVIGIRDGKQISYNDFCIVKIPSISVKEQKAIANVLNTADKELEVLNNQLHKLKEQKKGLMQQLLTGKKRLKF